MNTLTRFNAAECKLRQIEQYLKKECLQCDNLFINFEDKEALFCSEHCIKLSKKDDEVAFYNALEVNDSAVKVLGDDTLKEIAREIADKVRANATIDWTIRESARAKLMVLVKRTLTKYGYPPDKQQKAIDTVMRQAELLADNILKG